MGWKDTAYSKSMRYTKMYISPFKSLEEAKKYADMYKKKQPNYDFKIKKLKTHPWYERWAVYIRK